MLVGSGLPANPLSRNITGFICKYKNAGRSLRFNLVQSKLLVNGSTTISECHYSNGFLKTVKSQFQIDNSGWKSNPDNKIWRIFICGSDSISELRQSADGFNCSHSEIVVQPQRTGHCRPAPNGITGFRHPLPELRKPFRG